MAFEADELRIKDNTNAEQIRTRQIFEVLKEKAIKQEKLTEQEKDFFCLGVKISSRNDGRWEDYTCCDNYKFKSLYLTYFRDLTGGSSFSKVIGMTIYKVEPNEAQQDLQYLYDKSDEWDLIVQKANHNSQLLQQISAETRNDLKNLSKLPEFNNDPFIKGSFRYIFKKRAIILQSKYIYCIALEIFEKLKPVDLLLEINSIQIEFNEFSLIHILNRHFAEMTKQFSTNKSFHNEDFKPRILSVQLKEILYDIDISKLLSGKCIDKIGFQQNGIDYIIYTSEKEKSVKGNKGNITYRRLDTFFPVTDTIEYNNLISNCNLLSINQTLSVYVPL
jgi:hypothetical protein